VPLAYTLLRQELLQVQSIKTDRPEHDVSEEAGLQIISTPAQTLAVDCEIFGDPQNRVGQTAPLAVSKLLVKPTSCTTNEQSIVLQLINQLIDRSRQINELIRLNGSGIDCKDID